MPETKNIAVFHEEGRPKNGKSATRIPSHKIVFRFDIYPLKFLSIKVWL